MLTFGSTWGGEGGLDCDLIMPPRCLPTKTQAAGLNIGHHAARMRFIWQLMNCDPATARDALFSERFRAKACPGLDPGWMPVRVKKTRQNKKMEPRF
jgi:hypothetical protein